MINMITIKLVGKWKILHIVNTYYRIDFLYIYLQKKGAAKTAAKAISS